VSSPAGIGMFCMGGTSFPVKAPVGAAITAPGRRLIKIRVIKLGGVFDEILRV
jgi:hypothetical protein